MNLIPGHIWLAYTFWPLYVAKSAEAIAKETAKEVAKDRVK